MYYTLFHDIDSVKHWIDFLGRASNVKHITVDASTNTDSNVPIAMSMSFVSAIADMSNRGLAKPQLIIGAKVQQDNLTTAKWVRKKCGNNLRTFRKHALRQASSFPTVQLNGLTMSAYDLETMVKATEDAGSICRRTQASDIDQKNSEYRRIELRWEKEASQ